MGTIASIIISGLIICAILAFSGCVENTAVLYGILIFLIVCAVIFLIFFISSHIKSEKQVKNNVSIMNDNAVKRKENYTTWYTEKYGVPRKIIMDEGERIGAKLSLDLYWSEKDCVLVSEEKDLIIFGRKEIPFKSITNVEMITETTQHSYTTQRSNGMGNAIIGGILGGTTGAIIGASATGITSVTDTTTKVDILGITIYLDDINEPVFEYRNRDKEKNKTVYNTVVAIINKVKREREDKIINSLNNGNSSND